MTTLNTLNSDMGEILLTNLHTPAQDCSITMPVVSGKSAYDLAVENGFVGDLDAWLASIKGWQPVTSEEYLNLLNGELEKSPLLAELRTGINASNEAIKAEIQERIAAITAMNNELIAEAKQRVLDMQTYSAQLLSETQNRIADIESVRDQLLAEVNARLLETQQLADDILAEQVKRVSELTDLGNFIDSLDSKVDTNHTFILDHYSTSSSTTSEIADKISALRTTYIDPALNTKATVTSVEQVKTSITNINGELVSVGSKLDGVIAESGKNKQDIAAVWTDMQVRVEAESALSTRIDNVVATTYDHDARIANEVKARTDADSAMASNISTLTTKVGTTEGKITNLEKVTTDTNSSLSQVSNKLDNLVTTVDGKASSQAVTDLASRVTKNEGSIISQGSSITSLNNSVSTAQNTANSKGKIIYSNTAPAAADQLSQNLWIDTTSNYNTPKRWNGSAWLAVTDKVALDALTQANTNKDAITTKADASAVNTLANRVTTTEGKITSNSNSITTLNNNLSTLTNTVNTKADSSALSSLDSKVTSLEGTVTSQGSSITTLNNSLTTTNNNITAKGKVIYGTTAPVAADQLTQNLWIDTTNNANTPKRWNGNEWVVISDKAATDALAAANQANNTLTTKADSSALNSLTTRVNTAEGNITSQGTAISNLQNSVSTINGTLSKKAESSALTTLDNKVTDIDGKVSTNASNITTLQGNVTTINGTLSTKADSSAVSGLSSTVNTIDGRVTTNANNISSLTSRVATTEGNISKKLDATAISNYYTKTETDDVVSGKITEFNASLKLGGANLYYGENPINLVAQSSQGEWVCIADRSSAQIYSYLGNKLDISTLVQGDETIASIEVMIPSDSVGDFRIQFGTYRFSWASYLYAPSVSTADLPRDKWIKLITAAGNFSAATANSQVNVIFNLAGSIVVGAKFKWRNLMMEKGNKASQFSVSDTRMLNDLDANASAINSTNSTVSAIDGRVTTNTSNITSLSNRVTTAEGAISKKAETSALTSLDSKVTSIDGRVTTNANSITSLGNRLTTTENNVTKKADATAVSDLTSRVTAAEGNITSQSNKTTLLENSLSATDALAKGAVPAVKSFGNSKSFSYVCTHDDNRAGIAGNIIISTPITFTSKMFSITGIGYNYLMNQSSIDFNVSGYAYTGTPILSHSASNYGRLPIRIRLGVKNGTICIILTSLSSNGRWEYPKFSLSAVIGYTTPPDSWAEGWTSSMVLEADLATAGITNIVEPTMVDVNKELSANASALSTLSSDVSVIDGKVTATSSSVTTLSTTVNGHTSTLQANATTLNGLSAQYTVKVDVNGRVAGFGLASTAINGTPTSEFAVVADRFYIAAPNTTGKGASPFMVTTATTTINGVSVPAGTYLKDAFIYNGSIDSARIRDGAIISAKIFDAAIVSAKIADGNITTAKIGDLQVSNAKIANLAVDSIKLADLAVTNAKIANATITDAKIANLDAAKITTGYLSADRINANAITAAKIDSRGLTIKDAAGKVLFGSGTALEVSNITGLGSFATANKLTESNISTYIDGLGVKSLLVGDAQISNANIGTAQVGTLQLAGQSVSVTSVVNQTTFFDARTSAFTDAIYLITGGTTISVEFSLISCNPEGTGSFTVECFVDGVSQNAWTMGGVFGYYPSMFFPFLVNSSATGVTKIQVKVTSNGAKIGSAGYFFKASSLKR